MATHVSRPKIRLRFTGLTLFTSRIISVFTGLIFVVTVTRNVPLSEFGVWQYISLLTSYVMFPAGAINYWVTRDAARGLRIARTSIALNMAISSVGVVLFFSFSALAADFLHTSVSYFLIGGLTILVMIVVASLEAVAYGSIPHVTAYGFIAFEVTKVLLGLITVFTLRMGLLGALLSVLIAYSSQALTLSLFLRNEFACNIDLDIAKRWLRRIWLPVASNLAGVLSSLDVIIITYLTGSAEPIALLKTAQIVITTISYSSWMAAALYPKLLAGGDERDVTTSIKLVLMVALPMTVGAIVLANPLLRILSHQYTVAAPVLRVGAVSMFMISLWSVMNSVITGGERIDMEQNISAKALFNSRLFLPAKLSYASTILYVLSVSVSTLVIVNTGMNPIELNTVLAASLVGLGIGIPFFLYTIKTAREIRRFNFPKQIILKQLASVAIMTVVLFLVYPNTFAGTLLAVALGFVTYSSSLLLLDKETRDVVKAAMGSVRTR